jgi:hypothetical protein
MKILLALVVVAVAAVLVVSATMGADTLVPGGGSTTGDSTTGGTKAMPKGGATSTGKAALKLMSMTPLKLRGTGFRPGEKVKVKLLDGPVQTRNVTASTSGTFMVQMPNLLSQCQGLTVSAIGDKGSRAGFQFSQFACAAPGVGG